MDAFETPFINTAVYGVKHLISLIIFALLGEFFLIALRKVIREEVCLILKEIKKGFRIEN